MGTPHLYGKAFVSLATSDLDAVYDHIQAFGSWLEQMSPAWVARPPVTIRNEIGQEQLAFVLHRQDVFVGIFASPLEALVKIGDPQLTEAYYAFMRDRRKLYLGVESDRAQTE